MKPLHIIHCFCKPIIPVFFSEHPPEGSFYFCVVRGDPVSRGCMRRLIFINGILPARTSCKHITQPSPHNPIHINSKMVMCFLAESINTLVLKRIHGITDKIIGIYLTTHVLHPLPCITPRQTLQGKMMVMDGDIKLNLHMIMKPKPLHDISASTSFTSSL